MAATDNWSVLGVGGRPILNHIGSGVAFDMEGDVGVANRSWNIRVENITILGNASTSIGFRFAAVHHCILRNLRVLQTSSTGTAFRLEWTVSNLYENLVCTVSENNTGTTLPQFGIVVAADVQNSQDNTFLHSIIEGLTAVGAIGIHIVNGSHNHFIGGTSEANTKNVQVDPDCFDTMFHGLHFEKPVATPAVHASDKGQLTQWIDCFADNFNNATFEVEAEADHSVFIGGQIANLVVKPGAANVALFGTTLMTMVDNGTRTFRVGVYDEDAGVHAANILSSSLTFNPDATHDIGGSPTTVRPRDIHASRAINAGSQHQTAGIKVVGTRATGYTNAMAGTANRATAYSTGTITLQQLAERVKALQDDLTIHGLIGP